MRCKVVNRDRLDALLAEATLDCYGEEEEFLGVLYTMEEHLKFPLRAKALGDPVEVIGLDEEQSGPRRGILARVRKGDREYSVALTGLEFADLDPVSLEWLDVYRYWSGEMD
jgi:hypothetical protein